MTARNKQISYLNKRLNKDQIYKKLNINQEMYIPHNSNKNLHQMLYRITNLSLNNKDDNIIVLSYSYEFIKIYTKDIDNNVALKIICTMFGINEINEFFHSKLDVFNECNKYILYILNAYLIHVYEIFDSNNNNNDSDNIYYKEFIIKIKE